MIAKITTLKKILLTAFITASIQGTYAEPIRVMSLGDSITAGYPDDNYRLSLAEKLRSISCDIDFVGAYNDTLPATVSSHSAIWGVPAIHVDQYYIDTWMEKSNPDIVLMLLGVNDIQLYARTPEDTIENLRNIIGKIRAHNPSVKIFLGAYPNVRPDLPNVKVLNEMIPVLAEEMNSDESPVFFVDHSNDYNSALGADSSDTPPPELNEDSVSNDYNIDIGADTTDTLHPNVNGARKYANNWFKALVNNKICDTSNIVYNVALNKPVSVSENANGYGTPYLAVNDLVNDIGWLRAVTDGQEQALTIDLQGNYKINDIELSYVSTDAYQVEVSPDREAWTPIVEEEQNNKRKMFHQISPVDARYVRLTLKPPFVGNVMTVKEIRVMGTPISIP